MNDLQLVFKFINAMTATYFFTAPSEIVWRSEARTLQLSRISTEAAPAKY